MSVGKIVPNESGLFFPTVASVLLLFVSPLGNALSTASFSECVGYVELHHAYK